MIHDTTILEEFSSLDKPITDDKKTLAHRIKQPLKIYQFLYLTKFFSSSNEKGKVVSHVKKSYLFKFYNITGVDPTHIASEFEEWIKEGLFKQYVLT